MPPIDHFDYDDLEEVGSECECSLCSQFRSTFEEYKFQSIMCRKHSRSCACGECLEKNETRIAYLAALSQRDTYSELSYLTHEHKLGPQFLGWVFGKMIDPKFKTEAWWAIKAPSISLADWMVRWQELYLPQKLWAVSGIY